MVRMMKDEAVVVDNEGVSVDAQLLEAVSRAIRRITDGVVLRIVMYLVGWSAFLEVRNGNIRSSHTKKIGRPYLAWRTTQESVYEVTNVLPNVNGLLNLYRSSIQYSLLRGD